VAVPSGTRVRHSWKQGILKLSIGNFRQHAAFVLPGRLAVPLRFLPRAAPFPKAARYHRRTLLENSFDEKPVGSFPEGTRWVDASGPVCDIRVAAKAGAAEDHCLEFTDSPDETVSYRPFMYLSPWWLERQEFHRGSMAFSCDLMLRPGAMVGIHFRGQEHDRLVYGPSVEFCADDGSVRVRKREVARIAASKWYHVELAFQLGFDAGTFSLTLGQPGGAKETFADLPVNMKGFHRCDWVGILGLKATQETSFRIDNLRLEHRR